ncbi:glutathione S-transferase family protein [Parerythrobacter aestuarii]|uniref:glutathione S-transferase family protein n=1 Tax=Parerythrobacter aestuarii TaxID=3020909 RepID=UPI0024DEE3A2|nr:glutathione S-transferase family protein [Parerythrobacter aestuarii]
MAAFTFYTVAMSRGMIARWALHEAGADYEHEMMTWETRPDSYRALNPMNKVPTLVHHHNGHDHVITECAAICHYLAETHPGPELLPTVEEKADYFRWMFFAAGPLEQAIVTKTMGWEVPEERRATAGFGSFDLTVDTLDGWLRDRQFVCGDRFTMADVYVGSHVDWGLQFGTLPQRDAFTGYRDRINARDAKQAANAIDMSLMEPPA